MTIYKHSGKWHLFCYIKQLIFSLIFLFPVTEHLFGELFKQEKTCKLVQIGGIVMFNNVIYYVNNF